VRCEFDFRRAIVQRQRDFDLPRSPLFLTGLHRNPVKKSGDMKGQNLALSPERSAETRKLRPRR
jgi:hypothetical protein